MEEVAGIEGIGEIQFTQSLVGKYNSSASQSPKQSDDSVVYKLVRVQGDGRLVPATEDEVMEVKDLLEDDKMEIQDLEDNGRRSFSNEEPRELPVEGSKGLSQSANTEPGADKLDARLKEIASSSPLSLRDSYVNHSESSSKCSDFPNEAVENISSTSAACTTSNPILSEEICLDNLSIRELHETFKATFGRETNVKDKQWLIRRIAMGLTNSCEVTATTFIIRNNKWIKKEECFEIVDGSSTKEEGCKSVHATLGNICTDQPINNNIKLNDDLHDSGERPGNNDLEYDGAIDDLQSEQRAAKRVRRPTKRYIEELSEIEPIEYSGKLPSSDKNSGHGQTGLKSRVMHVQNVSSNGSSLVTRMDSLGNSGLQIPHVSRVRRSRPRRNVMDLMNFHPSGPGMEERIETKATDLHNSQPDNEIENEVLKARFTQKCQKPLEAVQGEDQQYQDIVMAELEPKVDLKQADSSGDVSDDNIVTTPTAKGGIRRKHHRAWTIFEVLKLVEGVSKYGAGKWSEIKRLAFASYSHRTSVDLKDKWRNLLRASFAQTLPDKGMNSRKHASAPPIPTSILLRVRELAEMHAQVPPNLSSSKTVNNNNNNGDNKSVHGSRSGYL